MRKIKKKNIKTKDNFFINLRMIFFAIIITIAFIIVIGHLAIIQFVDGKKLSEKAYNQQVQNQILSPNRGTIYDRNGEILAQSISVDTISLNPGKVTYANGKNVEAELLAKGLSEIFELEYEATLEKVNSNKSVVIIKKKVEKETVEKLQTWMATEGITAGINIDEDSKRYYPYNDLASNLIGFCGTDNSGQTGLEERWNNTLTGTAGKVVTTTDVNKKAISDEDEQYIASENGSNIYLTIDSAIQVIAEKYLDQAMIENSTAVSGNVIIMNPQTGEILAMATNPKYNLNEPSSYTRTGYSKDDWEALESADRTAALLNLWKNTNVSGTYEPGSTFKLITASVGLEEGIVQTDTAGDFYCAGKYHVGDRDISCWRTEPHGSQSLREALENSCNPAFMQLGQKIGAKTLYKYFQAFNLFEPVGNDIAKAYSGTFYELEKMGAVELATTSFGQRFEISPLQLITAVSAICNDGVLVKPHIVKQIENKDARSVEVIDTESVRQVISKDTADKVKNMMLSVVTDGTGWRAAVEGFSIGGKSGTAEPTEDKEKKCYVASFIAISPIENTQVVVLVSLSGLQEYVDHQGGQTCGPVAGQILSEVLPYLGVTSSTTAEKEEVSATTKLVSVPNVKDKTIAEAQSLLMQLGFEVVCNSTLDRNTTLVTDQIPKYGVTVGENSVVYLYTSDDDTRTTTTVPNVKDMTVEQAKNSLKSKNLNINIDGNSGIVVSQEPAMDTEVEEGTVVNVVIKQKLSGAQ